MGTGGKGDEGFMSIRFAPARNAANTPLARILKRGPLKLAANDHDRIIPEMRNTTEDALRHFAAHGLRAAKVALGNASAAAAAAHDEDYRYWLGICRELDAPAAARFEAGRSLAETRLLG